MQKIELPKTEEVIASMLKEDTGTHMLDSGGAYGRHWERNKEIESFEDLPEFEVEVESEDFIFVKTNIYHFLKGHVEYTEKSHKLTQEFKSFAEKEENKDIAWLPLMKEWTNGNPINTYNWENHLSQVLQFVPFTVEGEERMGTIHGEFILLQIHNGCDVRGGYTEPVVFECETDYLLSNMTDLYADCQECKGSWWSDDAGYSFYPEGSEEELEVTTSEENEIIHKGCGGHLKVFPMLQY